ncbi:ABC transporter ATP-binding protein [Litorihabitans aurantiacus]|uniref:ATP-binding protein n=1 Tax=Litorihabitans aurantiacus TaxID=1930061 RepID=A0AA37UH37_9MICO|nr:ABC transporter ATP-binding protein [Litorihabitans aurantiacus]GMA30498.1 ATP-binding protein [Litorihabitans aurantiacus]
MTARRAPAIELVDVVKDYTVDGVTTRALDRVSLTVGESEFVSLIGPSGCGKTTLLKIIDGLVTADSGAVLVQDREVAGPGPERAFVFQSFALLPWRTVRENIEFGLQVRRVPAAQRREVSDRYLEMVGLTGFADRYPDQLSGGMQQRVGLARALAVDPQILLMDEPFGALDAQTRHLLQSDLESIWEAGKKSVVFVTHDMDEAVFLSDRIVIMSPRPGEIHEIIDVDLPRPRTEEMRHDPRFTELSSYIWEQLRTMIVRQPVDKR